MAKVELLLPKMGESVAEATITSWLKSVGDNVEAEESLVEIATDKVDSEVPAPEDGKIVEILVQDGEVANVGQAIAIIETEGAGSDAPASTKEPEVLVEVSNEAPAAPVASAPSNNDFSDSDRFYSPLVKNIASSEGINLNELDTVPGTGQNGRVTKKDILGYIDNRGIIAPVNEAPQATTKPASVASPSQPKSSPTVTAGDGDEIIEMDRMRKLIADHMIMSKQTSPHVTSFVEADVTNVVLWRNKVKNEFQKREGQKITFTPIFIEAIAQAIKEFPMINVSVNGDKIIKKKAINVGMAAALPSGNLIVPVIKNADQLNLGGITAKVNDLTKRARENKLVPDEIQGGTYTVSNVGSFGNLMGTPIINQPQVAIMAVGAIVKKPAVIETPTGDMIAIRHKMFLSHSYDHRVVDGGLGGMFVKRVAEILENFDINRAI